MLFFDNLTLCVSKFFNNSMWTLFIYDFAHFYGEEKTGEAKPSNNISERRCVGEKKAKLERAEL